jgi:hypothetical protein
LQYVKKYTSIPVPTVIHYSSSSEALGREFILMEKMTGENLSTVWTQLNMEQKRLVLDQIAGVTKQLMDLSFTKFGSLYRRDYSTGQSDTCQDEFFVGVSSRFNSGPFDSFTEFIRSTIEDALQRVEQNPRVYGTLTAMVPKVREHLSGIVSSQQTRELLNSVAPSLTHGDYDLRNFLVDGTTITALLDWEFAAPCTIDEEWTESYSFMNEDNSLKEYFIERLRQIGGTVPSDMRGASERTRLIALRERVCPWWLINYHPDQRARLEEDIAEAVRDVAKLTQ